MEKELEYLDERIEDSTKLLNDLKNDKAKGVITELQESVKVWMHHYDCEVKILESIRDHIIKTKHLT